MKGYIHVYTGDGKGKTTAAFGLALRAVGAGKKVFIAQFAKGKLYSEIVAAQRFLPDITIRQFGLDCFIINAPKEADIEIARNGLHEVSEIIKEGNYDMIILDEANIAFYYNLFTPPELLSVVEERKEGTEVIITGRYAPPELIEAADLVTEMQETKHYYSEGVEARKGIEY
jgi:cob(I)alamin adenosyltransferase